MADKKEKKTEEEIKKYSLNKEEESNVMRIISTVGFLETLFDGLNLLMRSEQVRVERRVNIGQAPDGYRYFPQLDPGTMQLIVRKVKVSDAKPATEESKN